MSDILNITYKSNDQKNSIPEKYWKWRCVVGHFILSNRCRFRLCTDIGNKRISTVGACYRYDHSKKMEIIGPYRHYETMVFKLREDGEIGDYNEIDIDGIELFKNESPYNADKRAEKMHMWMCYKWSGIDNADQLKGEGGEG